MVSESNVRIGSRKNFGVRKALFRESTRFAIWRSGVRSPYGPPNEYWTNTYFFSGGFAVRCVL